ncbi:hypothetical protein VTJ83DRAFT_2734 [Remersonia thermophila]|uniref:Uncharacterized protein n=1 Tax=Remersonia thermophila TaxID=72144 RepID=A0ABR4DJN0_9PEZI
MLRVTRLTPGQRALLQHSPPATTATTTTAYTLANEPSSRNVTFVTGRNSTRWPLAFSGPITRSSPAFFRRPPSMMSPSTISTVALGSILGGSWYIWEESRTYKVGPEADRLEPRVVGASREGINPEYTKYDRWVEEHQHKKKKSQ